MEMTDLPLAFGIVSPWLLAGGLALSAAPLVIHLLRRRQYADRPWAAMQFLHAALHTQARRVRLESLALLVVRMLLIGTAAAALAQPYLEVIGGSLNQHAGRRRVLVIDTSLSMNAGEPGATPLDRARALAMRVVEAAPGEDSFSLVKVCRTPPFAVIPHAAHDRDAVLEQIRRLPATLQAADVAGALRTVRGSLREREPTSHDEVVIISDFQKTNWTPESAQAQERIATLLSELAEDSTVTCLPVTSPSTANLAVTNLKTGWRSSVDVGSIDLEATVLNSGTDAATDLTLEVFAVDRLVGTAAIDVPAEGHAVARIPLRGLTPADDAVRIAIPGDALLDDNQRWAILPERRPLNVLLVSGRPRTPDRRGSADFLQLALSPAANQNPAASMTPTVINDYQLQRTELSVFGCVHLCNIALFSEQEAARLQSYVQQGGGLVISLGEQAQPGGYRALQQGEDALLPVEFLGISTSRVSSDEAVRLSPGDYLHPVIRPFAGNPDAGLLTTEIDRYWRIRIPDDASTNVVLRYSTGDPAIIERRLGAGRVFIITTALDDSWGNWALWPSFVPIVHEVTRAAAAGRTSDRSRIVGDSLTRELPAEDFGVTVEHRTPDGEVAELPKIPRTDGGAMATVVADSSGIHELHLGPPRSTVTRFAVNVDVSESPLQALSREEVVRLAPDRAIRFLQEWQPETVVAAASSSGSVAHLVVLAVLGLLLVEQLLAWRFRVGAAALILLVIGVCGAGVSGHIESVLVSLLLLTPLAVFPALHRKPAMPPRGQTDRF